MFAVFCPRHRRSVLLSTSQIERLEHGGDGIAVHFRCTCGYRGVWRTGAAAQRVATDERVAG